MSKAFWPASKASIILLPSGAQGQNLFDFAKSWVEAGLLGPAIWVLPESIVNEPGSPPKVMATVLGISSDRSVIEIQVDLFEQIAREALKVIRLVKLRSSRPSQEFDKEQDEIVKIIEKYLGWSVPSHDKRMSDRDAVLDYQPINLICAPTEFNVTVQENWSRMGYGTTIIAAPEDRTSPWSSDAFVRDDAKFDGFTLMHLATVSGIWNGLPVGTLELFERERSGMTQVWLSRVFFSGVFTDGLARRIAAGFVEDLADPSYELLDAPDGTVFIDPVYEDAYIDVMVDASFLLDVNALEYQRPALPGDPDKTKLGILQQLGLYFVFTARRLARVPYWSFMWFKRAIAAGLQSRLQGKAGSKEVGQGLEERADFYDSAVLASYAQVEAERVRAEEAIKIPVKLAQVKSTHTLWQSLREMVFGSLDGGSDLTWAGFQPLDGDRRPVFANVGPVVPLIQDNWQPEAVLPKELERSGLDGRDSEVAIAQSLKAYLASKEERKLTILALIEAEQLEVAQLETSLDSQRAELSSNQGFKLSETGEEVLLNLTEANAIFKAAKAESGDGAHNLPEVIRAFKSQQKALREKLQTIDDLVTEAANLEESLISQQLNLQSLSTWLESTERTYLNKLSVAMTTRLDRVKDDLESMSLALQNLELPEKGTLIKLRKKFHKSLLIAVAIALGIATGYHLAHVQFELTSNPDWPVPATVWAISLIALIFGALGLSADYYRSWSEFDRTVALKLTDMQRVVDGHRKAQVEENRLSILYTQTLEWLAIIASALRKPWSVRESWKQSSLRALDLEKLPFAMRVAQAQADEEAPVYVLRNAAAQSLARRGWRSKSFEMLVAEVAKLSGKTNSFKVDSLDRDLPHASNGARRIMKEFMENSAVLERVAARQLKPIIEKLQGEAMTTARPKVLQVDLDPLSPIRVDPESVVEYEPEEQWDDFLKHTLTLGDGATDPLTPLTALAIGDAHIQSGEHEGVTGHVLLPQRVANELNVQGITNLLFTPHKEQTPAPIDSVVRVDLVGPLNPQITRLLSGDSVAGAGVELAEEDAPKLRPGAFD
jgi:hypothetical protein